MNAKIAYHSGAGLDHIAKPPALSPEALFLNSTAFVTRHLTATASDKKRVVLGETRHLRLNQSSSVG